MEEVRGRDRRCRVPEAIVGKVQKTLNDYRMTAPGDAVLVGVSGGPDSVCLLILLHRLSKSLSIRLGVAHLNHALRKKESDRDVEFVLKMAGSLGLDFYSETVPFETWEANRGSIEEKARKLRYAFFRKTADIYDYSRLALGHHAGDNAELFMMNLLSWSGPAGVSGIAPIREDTAGNLRIIRPLIRCSREEILDYLNRYGVSYVTDTSNFSMRFFRNRVRRHLIPELKSQFNPKIEAALNRLSTIMAAEEAWMNELTKGVFSSIVLEESEGGCVLLAEKLLAEPIAAQRRLLRMAIKRVHGSLRRITFDHVEKVRALLTKRQGAKSLNLPGGVQAVFETGRLIIDKAGAFERGGGRHPQGHTGEKISFHYRIEGPGTHPIPEIQRILNISRIDIQKAEKDQKADRNIAFFDAQSLMFPLILRSRSKGDRFEPLGVEGSQKIKKYFIDHKVPRKDRLECPLLLSEGRIAWVVGHRTARWARLTESTREVVRVQLLLALPENNV